MNALSKQMERVPMWVVQTIVTAVLTGGIAWCTWASVTGWRHEVRLGVVETKVDTVKSDIQEIKEGQKEMNRKLDRLIEKQAQPPPRLYGR